MADLSDYAKVGTPVIVVALGADTLATCPDLFLIFLWQVLIPLEIILFVIIFILVLLLQVIVDKDDWGVAFLKALFWALLVAIPFPVSLIYAAYYFKKKESPIKVINKAVSTSTGDNRNENGVQNIGDFNKSSSTVQKKDK